MSWEEPERHRIVENLNQVAIVTGWPGESLRYYQKRRMIEPRKDGKWSTRAIWNWYLKKEEEVKAARESVEIEEGKSTSKALERKREKEVELLDLELRERRKELVTVASVAEGYMQFCQQVRTVLKSLPERGALNLVGKSESQIREWLKKEARSLGEAMEAIAGSIELQHPEGEDE